MSSNIMKYVIGNVDVSTSEDECLECVNRAPGMPCASETMVNIIRDFVVNQNIPPESLNSAKAVMGVAKKMLGRETEVGVLTHPDIKSYIVEVLPKNALTAELETRFKPAGPRDSCGLLSNNHIDNVLQRWARVFPGFYPCPFAMMDFDTNGDPFGRLNLLDIMDGNEHVYLGPALGHVKRKCDSFGCVVNTDVSSGPGKHWVAVFVDLVNGTIEYFNSAGNPPPKVMTKWKERTRAVLATRLPNAKTIAVTSVRHQKSNTECGLYSLYYIRHRLEGTPYTHFVDNLIPDDVMIKFRKHVFRSGK